jgi:hypothetical protein
MAAFVHHGHSSLGIAEFREKERVWTRGIAVWNALGFRRVLARREWLTSIGQER